MNPGCRSKARRDAAGDLRAWSAIALLALAMSFVPLPEAVAQQGPDKPAKSAASENLTSKLRRPGDLTLNNTSLRQALFTISEIWEINLVVNEDIQGQVNGVFKNAPLHEILHSILYANGFGYQVMGQSLAVMRLEALGDLNPLFQTAIIGLRAAKPEDVLAGTKLLSSPQGKVQAIPTAQSLLVVDLPERITVIRQFAQELDEAAARLQGGSGEHGGQLQVLQFGPQFVKATSLQEAVQPLLSRNGKSAAVDAENRIIVVDHPAVLQLVQRLVEQMDVPRPQVRITAMIYDVSLESLERLGLNFGQALKHRINSEGVSQSLISVDSVMQMPAASGDPSGVMTLMNLSRHVDLSAVLQALNQTKDSRLLADPSITVVDRESAKIQIVTEIPFQQLTQSAFGGDIGTTAFRDAGVTLNVTPHIANNDTIQLLVTPTFSRLTGFTGGPQPMPIIDKREAQTTVRVANLQTLVLGGLRQRNDVNDLRGVPKLKDIKHFGKLFQARENTMRQSELIVFITPEIVTPFYAGHPREVTSLYPSISVLDQIPTAQQDLGCETLPMPMLGHERMHEEIETPGHGPDLHQSNGPLLYHDRPAEFRPQMSETFSRPMDAPSRLPNLSGEDDPVELRRLPSIEGSTEAKATEPPPPVWKKWFSRP